MLVSLAVRHARVPSNAIHRSLLKDGLILWNSRRFVNEILTVPRNDLHDIDGTSASEQALPSPYEKPVISAINPLGGKGASAWRMKIQGNNRHFCSMNLAHSADNEMRSNGGVPSELDLL